MPTGLPKSGDLTKRARYQVNAADMAKGAKKGEGPWGISVTWKTTNNKVATKPGIALVRNFKDGSVTVSQRASSCSSIHPGD